MLVANNRSGMGTYLEDQLQSKARNSRLLQYNDRFSAGFTSFSPRAAARLSRIRARIMKLIGG